MGVAPAVRRPAGVWGPAAVVAGFLGLVVGLVLLTHAWDPRVFATVGPQWTRHDPSNTRYADGRIYHDLAQDPSRAPALGWRRARRLLYPLLARVMAGGRPDLIPWTLLGINVAAIVGGTALVGHALAGWGRSPWYALGYGAWGGLGLALLHGTAEPLAFLLAISGLVAAERGSRVLSGAAFLGALVTHEAVLPVVGPYAFAGRPASRGLALGRAVCVFVLAAGWLGFIAWWVGWPRALGALESDTGHFAWPLRGLLAAEGLHRVPTLVQLGLPTVAAGAAAVWHLWRSGHDLRLWAMVLAALFVLTLTPASGALLWHSGRLATGLVVATLAAAPTPLGRSPAWRALVVAYASTAIWTLAVTLRYVVWGVAPW